MTKILIKAQADVLEEDDNNNNPLTYALKKGDVKVSMFLLEWFG